MVQQVIVRIICWRGFRPRLFKFKLKMADGMTKLVCVWHGRPQDPTILVAAKGWHCVSGHIKDYGLNGSLSGQEGLCSSLWHKSCENSMEERSVVPRESCSHASF